MNRWRSGESIVDRTDAKHRRVIHYWLTIVWLTLGSVVWIVERDALWFVGFMSLYAIWITHLAGWAAETPVESEADTAATDRGSPGSAEVDTTASLGQPEPN